LVKTEFKKEDLKLSPGFLNEEKQKEILGEFF
jgi:hypothetical protein